MAPSVLHQAMVELLRMRPDLLLLLAHEQETALSQACTSLEVIEGNLDQVAPPEYDADLVVLVRRGEQPQLAAVLEVQLRVDPDKLLAWPAYAASARRRHRCESVVIVLCMDDAVATWAARPIRMGPGNDFRCAVVGPVSIPRILDPSDARGIPELAVLSALAHATSSDALPIAFAALATFGELDADRSQLYYDLICAELPEAARRALENAMMKVDLNQLDTPAVRFWIDKGRNEGRSAMLVEMLAERFGDLTSEVHARIASATPEDLRLWGKRLLTADTLDDVFGSGS